MSETALNQSFNDKINFFNREIHQYEDSQVLAIQNIWQQVERELIATNKLSDQKAQQLHRTFAQALVNLNALMHARTAYEAELYYQSLGSALQAALSPRPELIALHAEMLDLVVADKNLNHKISEINSQCLNLKNKYRFSGIDIANKFDQVSRLLLQLKEPQTPETFKLQRSALLNAVVDINELSVNQKQADNLLNSALNHSKTLFDTRTLYLEDKRDLTHKLLDKLEDGWFGTGIGLALIPIALAVAIPTLAPVVSFGIGVASAAHGVIDLSRTTANTITQETTIKLGKREVVKPEPTTIQRATNFAKKASPTGLCMIGVAISVAAIVVTGGTAAIGLGVGGLVVTGLGLGMMGYQKSLERKKIKAVREKHQAINKVFCEPLAESDHRFQVGLDNQEALTAEEQYENSNDKATTLLAGHHLDAEEIKHIIEELQQEEVDDNPIPEPALHNQTIVPEPSLILDMKPDAEEDDTEGEGRGMRAPMR